MTCEGFDGFPLSVPLDSRDEISVWLSSLHLPQYASSFTLAGYFTLEDCRGLTEEKLLDMGHFPTGHRRRILRSLEVFMDGEGSERRKPVPYPRNIFLKDGKRVTRPQKSTAENINLSGTQSLPARTCEETVTKADSGRPFSMEAPHTLPRRLPKAACSGSSSNSLHSSSESLSLSSHSLPSDWENSEEPAPPVAGRNPGVKRDSSLEDVPEGFQGEMVVNDIYESAYTIKGTGPRKTRSYRLRHRPVPEVPEWTIIPSHDWSASAKTSTEQQSGAEGPSAPSGRQKVPLQRTLSPITPYGELYLYNKDKDNTEEKLDGGAKEMFRQETKEKLKQKKPRKHHTRLKQKVTDSMKRRDFSHKCTTAVPDDDDDDDYSLIQPCSQSQASAAETSSTTALSPKPLPPTSLPFKPLPQTQTPARPSPQTQTPARPSPQTLLTGAHPQAEVSGVYSEPVDALSGLVKHTLPAHSDSSISPYACYYGAPKGLVKMGWLDKLSPQGNCVFQRRWVKFDGENLTYHNNDKEMYSKGLVPLSAIKMVRSVGDNKLEVVTSQRTFVFRAEKEGERQDWLEVLQSALKSRSSISHKPCKHSSSKSGYVELRGHKGRVYLSLTGTKVRLCKTDQDFNSGLAIAVVDLTAACVKHVDRRSFEINTPFRSFCK